MEGQNVSNTEYVYQFLLNILSDTFSNVSKSDTVEILNGLFATGDEKQFNVWFLLCRLFWGIIW